MMEKLTVKDDQVAGFVKLLQGKLEKEGIKVTPELLKKALVDTSKEHLRACEQCANGWHW
jgi:hypothetical protein